MWHYRASLIAYRSNVQPWLTKTLWNSSPNMFHHCNLAYNNTHNNIKYKLARHVLAQYCKVGECVLCIHGIYANRFEVNGCVASTKWKRDNHCTTAHCTFPTAYHWTAQKILSYKSETNFIAHIFVQFAYIFELNGSLFR